MNLFSGPSENLTQSLAQEIGMGNAMEYIEIAAAVFIIPYMVFIFFMVFVIREMLLRKKVRCLFCNGAVGKAKRTTCFHRDYEPAWQDNVASIDMTEVMRILNEFKYYAEPKEKVALDNKGEVTGIFGEGHKEKGTASLPREDPKPVIQSN